MCGTWFVLWVRSDRGALSCRKSQSIVMWRTTCRRARRPVAGAARPGVPLPARRSISDQHRTGTTTLSAGAAARCGAQAAAADSSSRTIVYLSAIARRHTALNVVQQFGDRARVRVRCSRRTRTRAGRTVASKLQPVVKALSW
ncbi:unnamed protein product [Pieris brassicae]|uniref:Uncharacterized protein n=1 Tax=Pieris brassicae TaxID=7116 RepID=A0A9P0TRE3_PIEBR|nr:unnamed protein product [Pieris brassicae]